MHPAVHSYLQQQQRGPKYRNPFNETLEPINSHLVEKKKVYLIEAICIFYTLHLLFDIEKPIFLKVPDHPTSPHYRTRS